MRFPRNCWQAVATVSACLSRFRRRRVCHRLPPVAPARLHKCSIRLFTLKNVGRLFELYAVVSDGLVVREPAVFADSFGAFRSSDGSARRLLKLFQRRECGRLAGRCELRLWQFCLEPLERRAGGEGVGRGQLLVAYREREEHGGTLVFGGIFREARADPAQCKKLERDGLRGVRTFERVVEALASLGAVSEREGGEADAAERGDHPPAVVDLGEGLVAGAPEPQRLGVVTRPNALRLARLSV